MVLVHFCYYLKNKFLILFNAFNIPFLFFLIVATAPVPNAAVYITDFIVLLTLLDTLFILLVALKKHYQPLTY